MFCRGPSRADVVETHEEKLCWMEISAQLTFLLIVRQDGDAREVEDRHFGSAFVWGEGGGVRRRFQNGRVGAFLKLARYSLDLLRPRSR